MFPLHNDKTTGVSEMVQKLEPDWEIVDAIMEMEGTDAYKCYQCGKCAGACPLNMLDVVTYPVYRVPYEVKLGVIDTEGPEVWQCVGCEACKDQCPKGISQAKIMRAVRRILAEFGGMPDTLQAVVASISSGGNPFMEGPEKRAEWARGLDIPKFDGTQEYFYFSCCTPAYDARAQKLAVATTKILKRAGVPFGILGETERCCCEAIRRGGAEEVFTNVATANIAAFAAAGVRKILVQSPHCYITFKNEYPEFGGNYEVEHVTQLFIRLIKEGRLKPEKPVEKKAVYHDPCTLGRQSGIYEEPREVLKSIPGLELVEFANFNREFSVCCGGGGGGLWVEQEMDARLSNLRVRQAITAGAEVLVVACPYCLQMFEDAAANLQLPIEVKDISELLAESLGL